jgi:riboflavin synthase
MIPANPGGMNKLSPAAGPGNYNRREKEPLTPMFTGIVETIGTVQRIEPGGRSIRLQIKAPALMEGTRTGDSIAVDGCCLTVEKLLDGGAFEAYASPETMRKTALGDRRPGDGVNLERALQLHTRLGGHLVSGHVDATGRFESARQVENAWEVRIGAPREILHQSIAKGSVAVDGISLTIATLDDTGFTVWIIPETWTRTTLAHRRPGDRVNLESDLVGKYVYRFLETRGESGRPGRIESLLQGGNWGSR